MNDLNLPVAPIVESPPPTPAPPDGTAAWPSWQRLLFRYAACHYVAYAFPRPLTELLQTLAAGLAAVHLDTSERPWRWPAKWLRELGDVETGWQKTTTWMHEHGLAPYEVIHQPTGSGDTGHDIAKLLAIVVVSLLLTTVWSLLQRRPCSYPRLGRWLHLIVRFDLAFTLIGYGLAKFYGGQFGELGIFRATQEIGDTTPMGMVGTFMQAFPGYELFGGAGEVLGGLLLFHHRTALLGAVVSIGVLTNVCAINWLCGVPVKLFSTHLLLFAIGLLAPFWPRLWALFVRNTPSSPVDVRVARRAWARWTLLVIGFAWVIGSLVSDHFGRSAFVEQIRKGREKSALWGLWIVEEMSIDGKPVPPTDAARWRSVAIDAGTLAWARDGAGRRRFFEFAFDAALGTAQVRERTAGGQAEASAWTCEQGTTITQVDPPLLMRAEDRGRRVDGERRTLTLKGKLGDQQIELQTVEKQFRIRTGFRLRQELPEGW